MKKYISLVVVTVFVSMGVSAQNSKGLKGPAAKNYKPWKDKNKSSVVIVTKDPHNLRGGAAKNYKPWMQKSKEETNVYVLKSKNPTHKMRSPEAKNYKPWRNQKDI